MESVTALPDGWVASSDGAVFTHKVANVSTKRKPFFIGDAASTALFQGEKTVPDIKTAITFIRRVAMQSTGLYMCREKLVVGCMAGAGWAEHHKSTECGDYSHLVYLETNSGFADALRRKFHERRSEITVLNENPCWSALKDATQSFDHVVVSPGLTSAAWSSTKTAEMFVYNLSRLITQGSGAASVIMVNPSFAAPYIKQEFGSRVDVPCGPKIKAPLYAVPMESFNRLLQARSLYVTKRTPCDQFLRGECSREYVFCGGFPEPTEGACQWATHWCLVELKSIWPPLPRA